MCQKILVRGDDIFEAEHLPSYARTYILPRQMVRKSSKKEDDPKAFNINYPSVPEPVPSRKASHVNGATNERKESVQNADFQFSMLKASLDYDTEIFGSNVSQHVIENNPLSRNISTINGPPPSNGGENNPNGLDSFRRKSKKESFQNCNSPGAMLAYAQYTQVKTKIFNSESSIITKKFSGRRICT